MKSLTIDPQKEQAPTRDFPSNKSLPGQLPLPKEANVHPSKPGGENASLFFVGTATTIRYACLIAQPQVNVNPLIFIVATGACNGLAPDEASGNA
jgi:hypothetical protein